MCSSYLLLSQRRPLLTDKTRASLYPSSKLTISQTIQSLKKPHPFLRTPFITTFKATIRSLDEMQQLYRQPKKKKHQNIESGNVLNYKTSDHEIKKSSKAASPVTIHLRIIIIINTQRKHEKLRCGSVSRYANRRMTPKP